MTAILAVLAFAGGAEGCTPSNEPGHSTTIVISGQSVYAGWGETATFADDIRMVAYAPKVDPRATPVYPGDIVLYCMVDITNGGSSPLKYDLARFGLYAKDKTCPGGLNGKLTTVSEPPLASGTLAPGETVQGAVPFELPEDQVPTIQQLFFHCHSRVEVPGGLNDIGWSVYWSDDQ